MDQEITVTLDAEQADEVATALLACRELDISAAGSVVSVRSSGGGTVALTVRRSAE